MHRTNRNCLDINIMSIQSKRVRRSSPKQHCHAVNTKKRRRNFCTFFSGELHLRQKARVFKLPLCQFGHDRNLRTAATISFNAFAPFAEYPSQCWIFCLFGLCQIVAFFERKAVHMTPVKVQQLEKTFGGTESYSNFI